MHVPLLPFAVCDVLSPDGEEARAGCERTVQSGDGERSRGPQSRYAVRASLGAFSWNCARAFRFFSVAVPGIDTYTNFFSGLLTSSAVVR